MIRFSTRGVIGLFSSSDIPIPPVRDFEVYLYPRRYILGDMKLPIYRYLYLLSNAFKVVYVYNRLRYRLSDYIRYFDEMSQSSLRGPRYSNDH